MVYKDATCEKTSNSLVRGDLLRGVGLTRLLQGHSERALRDLRNDRIYDPGKRSGHRATQSKRFELNVNATVCLLIFRGAVQSPDEAVTLIGRETFFIRLTALFRISCSLSE